MRNLKRVLSLTLASAMLFGMMVMGASAADKKPLTDLDKVTNKEAVNLMVDLGIIAGKPDGSFAPAEAVDRATMAKLITYIMMGDVDQSTFAGTTTALKDIDGHWAEGYIKYCFANGIISGDGTNFYPSKGVTTVEAAKMLLVALGYDAALQGYTNNASWSVNIMRDAQKSGLTNKVNTKASDALTREDAAQMIYNALFANTISLEYTYDQGVKYVSKVNANVSTLGLEVYGLAKVNATVTDIDPVSGDVTLAPVVDANDSAATRTAKASAVTAAQGKGYQIDAQMAGSVITVYSKNAYAITAGKVDLTYDKLYSSAPTAATSGVIATVKSGISDFDKAALKGDKAFVAPVQKDATNANYTATFFYNGKGQTIDTATVGSFADAVIDAAIAKPGAITEFVDANGDGVADIVKVTDKTVATLTADPTTKVVGDDTQVKVPGVINAFTSANTAKTVVGYEDLKKGDVVLYVKIGNVTYLEKATTVEGVATAKNSASAIKIDSTYYTESGLNGKSYSAASWTDYTNTYTFYLDNGNNIIKAVALTDNASSNYAVALQTAWVSGTTIGASNYAQAKLLFSDGSAEVVTISKIDGYTPAAEGTDLSTQYSDSANSNVGSSHSDLDAGSKVIVYQKNSSVPYKFIGVDATTALTANTFYTYVKDSDGAYVLTSKAASSGNQFSGTAIVNNKASFATGKGYIGNSNTVFLVQTGTATKPVYTAYTGVANLPGMSAASGFLVANDAGVATYVFIGTTGTLTGSVGQYVTFAPNDSGAISYTLYPASGNIPAYYEVKGTFNGEAKDDIKLSSSTGTFSSDYTGLTANTLYKVDNVNSDMVIQGGIGSGLHAETVVTGIAANAGGTLVDSASTAYTYDADTVVYYISGGDVTTPDAASIKVDATDVLFVEVGTNNYAKTIYVIDKISRTTAVASVDVYVNGVKATVTGGSATGSTLATANVGDVISLKVTVNNQGISVVSDHVVVAGNKGSSVAFTISLTAENGTAMTPATYTLAITA